jgi:hypothetical protein
MRNKQLFPVLFLSAFLLPLSLFAADTSSTMHVALRQLNEAAQSYETAHRALAELISGYGGAVNAPVEIHQRLVKAQARALEEVLAAVEQALSEHTYQELALDGVFSSLVPVVKFEYEELQDYESSAVKPLQEKEYSASSAATASEVMSRTQQVAFDRAQEAKEQFKRRSSSLSQLTSAYGSEDRIPDAIRQKLLEAKARASSELTEAQRQHLIEYALSLHRDGKEA